MSAKMATAQLTARSVLAPAPWCTVREQATDYLFYNSRSDELHLVSPTGHYLYRLCDGVQSISEICDQLAGAGIAAPAEPVVEFYGGLVQRGILEDVSGS